MSRHTVLSADAFTVKEIIAIYHATLEEKNYLINAEITNDQLWETSFKVFQLETKYKTLALTLKKIIFSAEKYDTDILNTFYHDLIHAAQSMHLTILRLRAAASHQQNFICQSEDFSRETIIKKEAASHKKIKKEFSQFLNRMKQFQQQTEGLLNQRNKVIQKVFQAYHQERLKLFSWSMRKEKSLMYEESYFPVFNKLTEELYQLNTTQPLISDNLGLYYKKLTFAYSKFFDLLTYHKLNDIQLYQDLPIDHAIFVQTFLVYIAIFRNHPSSLQNLFVIPRIIQEIFSLPLIDSQNKYFPQLLKILQATDLFQLPLIPFAHGRDVAEVELLEILVKAYTLIQSMYSYLERHNTILMEAQFILQINNKDHVIREVICQFVHHLDQPNLLRQLPLTLRMLLVTLDLHLPTEDRFSLKELSGKTLLHAKSMIASFNRLLLRFTDLNSDFKRCLFALPPSTQTDSAPRP